MKLLKLEIGDITKEKQFRSLHAGFKIEFHDLSVKGTDAMHNFSPFCFAGLNGSGKSNVLEAIAAIFFHLECCVAKFKPKAFEKYFRKEECNPDAFLLEYLVGQHDSFPYALFFFDKITIQKEVGKAPEMFRQRYPFSEKEEKFKISLETRNNIDYPQAAEGKSYLPDIVVGYSSGENEILSLPFRKTRLINFDKYKEDYIKNYQYEEPENSLIYIDSEMSQAVLLACLLYEDEETLKPLRKELGIVGLRSFRMNLNIQHLVVESDKKGNTTVPILQHIQNIIEDLKKCATCWQEISNDSTNINDKRFATLILDFFVDDKTKSAFKAYFTTSFDLFRFFQVLYELNSNHISDLIKEEVYKSRGFYTDGKLPEGSPDQNVFYFLDYLILKEIDGEKEPKPLLLREFSDGEHQFLHTMGICLMLQDRRSILLLDEPETHFNPSWRAKFIKILDDSLKAEENKIHVNGSFNVQLLKDILLTSHSPFIISDCMPDNVLFFKRDEQTKLLEAKKASELGIKTYGSSVDYILKNFFKTSLVSNKSFDELKNIIDHGTIDELRKAVEDFGESSEKQFLFRKIYEKMEKKDDN